jgi:hypothetical protein
MFSFFSSLNKYGITAGRVENKYGITATSMIYVGLMVENKVLKGPDNDLGEFLESVDQFSTMWSFSRSIEVSKLVMGHLIMLEI